MSTQEKPEPEQQQQQQQQQSIQRPRVYEMEINPFVTTHDEPEPTNLWDWGDLLDFTVDDHPIALSFDSDHHHPPSTAVPPPVLESPVEVDNLGGGSSDNSDRIRKRDPRLVCENFLAGLVPCACPEMDAMLAEEEEEEEGGRGKKKARTARAPAGTARCQVPGCEADIRELKGYHRRHRVCLKCANATEVLIHEQSKRYCQQCGKFHVLSDFDEGKRSCRRKLERHNNRRRRKSSSSKGSLEKESQEDLLTDDISCDVEAEKDKLCSSNQIVEKDSLLESEDGNVSALCSAPNSQNVQGDSVVSFVASDETQIDGGNDNLKHALSSSYCDNKSAYSSTCPTGRISFKLYDWNPAEFPRRLRHQIFQWLACMPVELEGYIRPGCTILTAFIAMPKITWIELLESPASYLHDFVVPPGRLLSGKGSVLVYMNDMIFHIVKDGTSVMKVKEQVRAPRIHYVHPTCFEAGKPMEFVTCGSNLLQPKFRFLVSFSGKYLKNECCISPPHDKSDGDSAYNLEHQLYKIHVPHAEPNLFGPAFVEVENESGLSNFIPILIGDKEVCSEMKKIQQRFDASLRSKGSHFEANSCQASVLRQTMLSEFILDIAWLLKEPASDSIQNSLVPSQIQRYNCLLNFLICHDSITILEKVIQSLKILIDRGKCPTNFTNEIDIKIFQKNVNFAKDILCEKFKKRGDSVLHSRSVPRGGQLSPSSSTEDMLPIVPISNQDTETRSDVRVMAGSPSLDRTENVPLLNRDFIMNVSHNKDLPRQSCSRVFSTTSVVLGSRPAVFVIAFAVVCFGLCAILLHPQKVGEFAVSIRRCVFDNR